MTGFIKFLVVLVIIAALVGAVGLIYTFTNGFNEDFKTFYVEYGGEKILTDTSTLKLCSGKTHTFNVHYTFDNNKSQIKDYKVKIVPNVTEDFDFRVDGEVYCYSEVDDLSNVFSLKKGETSFEIVTKTGLNLESVLKALYSGKTVVVPEYAGKNNPEPYTIVVSSYNDNVVLNINFAIVMPNGTNVEEYEPEPFLPDTPVVKPEDTKYKIHYTLAPVSGLSTAVIANPDPETNTRNYIVVEGDSEAVAGKQVKFSYWMNFIGQIGDGWEVKTAKFQSGNNTVYCQFNSHEYKYYFDMPAHDVTVVLVLEYVESPTPDIVVQDIEYYVSGCSNSEITVDCPQNAAVGSTVTITTSNYAEGVEVLGVHCVGNGTSFNATSQGNGVYTFTMPDCRLSVQIQAKFTPPDNATYYYIDYTTLGSGSDMSVSVDTPVRATAGTRISFTISLVDLSEYFEDYTEVEISNVSISDEDDNELDWSLENGKIVFIMPSSNVTIYIYLMPVEDEPTGPVVTTGTYVGTFKGTWRRNENQYTNTLIATENSVELTDYWAEGTIVTYLSAPVPDSMWDWIYNVTYSGSDIGKMYHVYIGANPDTSKNPIAWIFYVVSEDAWHMVRQPNTSPSVTFNHV